MRAQWSTKCAFRVNGSADHSDLVARRNQLKRATLKRGHLHHLMDINVQESEVDEPGVRSGDEKLAGTCHVDARRTRCCQRAVPELHKRLAAVFAGPRVLKHLLRLHIQKAEPHGPLPHDALKVSAASTAAKLLFGIERHDGVPTLPSPFGPREPSKSDSLTERPHPAQPVELSPRGGDPRGDRVCVIKDAHGGAHFYIPQCRRECDPQI